MGCLLYTLIGIWILRKILLRYFSDTVTTIVMVLLVLGTNYFELTAYDGALVHNSLFTLYTLIIWYTIRWHEAPKWRYAILLGIFIGLSALIRPTEIIGALIPIFWGIYNKDSLKRKWSLVTNHRSQVICMILVVIIIGFIQLIYWKIHAGSWIYYSYEEGEQLKFLAPYIMFVLLSWKKGWLIYTPMMIFPLLGFILLYKRNLKIFWATILFFAINLLIVSSWTTWWYGGSLGQRSLMQSYAIMALPFGAFIAWILRRKNWIKIVFGILAVFFIWLNLFQTWQYMTWIIDPSRMTKEYYWAIFGRKHVDPSKHKLLEVVENFDREFLENGQEHEKRTIAFHNFEYEGAAEDPHLSDEFAKSGAFSLRMDSTIEFSPGIKTEYRNIDPKEGSWIRAHIFIYPVTEMTTSPANLVITMSSGDGSYKYKSIALEDESFQLSEWNEIVMDYEIPYVSDKDDMIAAYIWNRGKVSFFVDDIHIELLEPREE
ncbi:glycosyltransferase family 39 protein [candidate division KSB1 bacterium]|nr:glycosyltransferase family 39 protein [candidate division KSB1 bacterium]